MNRISKYRFFLQTPIGVLTVIYEETPFLLKRIQLPQGRNSDTDYRNKKPSEDTVNRLEGVSRLIASCLNGTDCELPWEIMSFEKKTDLQIAVYRETVKIPFGKLSTYKEIARCIGRPKAFRFVGTALSKNPFPIIIPCHRVIRSDNKIGGFGGGSKLKQLLIEAEEKGSSLLT